MRERGEEKLAQAALRQCLAENGFEIESARSVPARIGLGSVAPDFRAYLPNGNSVAVVVEPSAQRAQRDAADIRSSLRLYTSGNPDLHIVDGKNVVLVFEVAPAKAQRETAADCLG